MEPKEYRTIKIRKKTLPLLRLLAALKGVPMMDVVHKLAENEKNNLEYAALWP